MGQAQQFGLFTFFPSIFVSYTRQPFYSWAVAF
jgi:hypothetical protein